MLVKAMTTHNISPIQQIAQVEVCTICFHFDHTTRAEQIHVKPAPPRPKTAPWVRTMGPNLGPPRSAIRVARGALENSRVPAPPRKKKTKKHPKR